MKVKVFDLSGKALSFAVAHVELPSPDYDDDRRLNLIEPDDTGWCFRPDIDWAQGGPIMERENICIRGIEGGFHAWYHQHPPKTFGPTMLIAAMRCYAASKLGGEIDVPEELLL